ncbi:MAG: ROK family protein [Bacilli bacterium]|nr:ROK family protein [Bacilli bacterium]
MKCVFGIDIGGTDIKIGKFYNDELVLKTSIKTNRSDDGIHIFPDIFKKIDELLGDDILEGIGVGVPGPVLENSIVSSKNLGWDKINILEIIKNKYPNIAISLLNDANAAAVGEMIRGGAVGYHSFIFITLGTGIGGGIIIDDELIEGNTGSAGEIGHIRVGFNNERLCKCGLFDCVEQYSSATGIVHTANILRLNRETKLNEVEVTSKNIFDYAKLGDEVALEAVNSLVEKLSTALAAVTNTVNPEAIVVGGGVSKAGDFLIDRLEKRFNELCFFSVRGTKFALAKLGNDAGMYGTNYMVRKKLNAN